MSDLYCTLFAYQNKDNKFIVIKNYHSGLPSIAGKELYNDYYRYDDVALFVGNTYSYVVDHLHEISSHGWSYVFINNEWYVKYGNKNPDGGVHAFVPLTDYMQPFGDGREFSDTPFVHRNNVNCLPILFDMPIYPRYNTRSLQQGKPMELNDLLKQTGELFAAYEKEKPLVGCSLVIEGIPSVYTWNSETKSFDKDEFPA